MKITLLRITDDPEGLIEEAGRLCYKSEPGNRLIIRKWIERGHTSMLEHAIATFLIEGVSRVESHQHVRHRMAAYSQQSQRYVSEDNFNFVTPESISSNPDAKRVYDKFMSDAKTAYVTLRSYGIKKEDARFVLPNSVETHFVTTFNFRSLRNFLDLRMEKDAQWEIREVANTMLALVKPYAPNCFYDYEVDIDYNS